MAQRCPTAKWAGTATMPGYALKFRVHADVEPNENTSVLGVLWIVDDEAIQILDGYEGYPHYYTRFDAQVWQDGEPITALVYKMVDQTFQDMPNKQYLTLVTEGYQQSNVPTDQLSAAIEKVKTDPQWDPIFNRIKKTDARLFKEAIMKDEYYDMMDD